MIASLSDRVWKLGELKFPNPLLKAPENPLLMPRPNPPLNDEPDTLFATHNPMRLPVKGPRPSGPILLAAGNDDLVEGVMNTILELRKDAKLNKDWAAADKIRDELTKLNIVIKDTKDGSSWEIKE